MGQEDEQAESTKVEIKVAKINGFSINRPIITEYSTIVCLKISSQIDFSFIKLID